MPRPCGRMTFNQCGVLRRDNANYQLLTTNYQLTPMWKYYAILSAVFAALTAILAKCGVHGLNPNLATAVRTTVVLLLTWGVVVFTGKAGDCRALDWKSAAFLVASGLATGLSWLFYFKALACGDVSRVAPVDKLSVVLVALFGVVFLHEKLGWAQAAGIACIAAGTLLMLRGD